jgi:hypothetical protein
MEENEDEVGAERLLKFVLLSSRSNVEGMNEPKPMARLELAPIT